MSCADLAKNRINILDIKSLGGWEYAINFEYCYINKDGSKVWVKNVLCVNSPTMLDVYKSGKISKQLIDMVTQARAELEK